MSKHFYIPLFPLWSILFHLIAPSGHPGLSLSFCGGHRRCLLSLLLVLYPECWKAQEPRSPCFYTSSLQWEKLKVDETPPLEDNMTYYLLSDDWPQDPLHLHYIVQQPGPGHFHLPGLPLFREDLHCGLLVFHGFPCPILFPVPRNLLCISKHN